MTTIRVHNWDKWQTYRKDRGTPPWIKVHKVLLSNEKWALLSDSEKGQLISLWIISSDKNGELSSNPQILRKMAQLDEEPNINKFIELGFFVKVDEIPCQPPDNQVVTTCQESDAPETETETETEGRVCSVIPREEQNLPAAGEERSDATHTTALSAFRLHGS